MTYVLNKIASRHAESALAAVNASNGDQLLPMLEALKADLKAAQLKRVEQVIRKMRTI